MSYQINSGKDKNSIDRIICSFCFYIGILLLNGIWNFLPSFIGAIFFLVLTCVFHYKEFRYFQVNTITVCVFYCLLLSVIPMVSYDKAMIAATFQELVKYYALFFVILIATFLPFGPLSQSKKSKVLYSFVLSFLFVGWLFSVIQGVSNERISGFLANPNNFALTALLLFFLVDLKNSSIMTWVVTHVLVLLMIYVSQTSGAILGYVAGVAYYLINIKKQKMFVIISFLLLSLFVCVIVFNFDHSPINPIASTLKKISVLKENYGKVMSGKSVDYYSSIIKQNGDYTSALWRFSHWTTILKFYFNSTFDKILFGYGIGSTDVFFGTKAHNDYLRLLFEGGIVSFLFNVLIWGLLYNQMKVHSRWIVVSIAVFSITENNYDHFLAMSLLVFYMVGNRDCKKVRMTNAYG